MHPIALCLITSIQSTSLLLSSPSDFQVFQRQTSAWGQVFVSGRAPLDCKEVSVRFLGKPMEGKLNTTWRKIPVDPAAHTFNSEIGLPAGGWYQCEIWAGNDRQTVNHIGIGEVFVGAGQSNSTNSGGEGGLKTESQMVSTFGGENWRLADDPQPGVHDKSGGGSFWPAFGDAMYERYHVPIGLAVTGHGGTSVNQWQKDGELFNWTLGRIRQLGKNGFRALLWHQGESDTGMTAAEYGGKLQKIILDSQQAAGWSFPWIVAQVSYHNPSQPLFRSTRDAQRTLWNGGIALEGPDTDMLGGPNRDGNGQGIHFSPTGLRAHGKLWADHVGAWLDGVLGVRKQ